LKDDVERLVPWYVLQAQREVALTESLVMMFRSVKSAMTFSTRSLLDVLEV